MVSISYLRDMRSMLLDYLYGSGLKPLANTSIQCEKIFLAKDIVNCLNSLIFYMEVEYDYEKENESQKR